MASYVIDKKVVSVYCVNPKYAGISTSTTSDGTGIESLDPVIDNVSKTITLSYINTSLNLRTCLESTIVIDIRPG